MKKIDKIREELDKKGREIFFEMRKIDDSLSTETIDKYTYELDKLQSAYEMLVDIANLIEDIERNEEE